MYDKLNITENSLRVLSLFTRGFDRNYYIREIERIVEISPRTAQLILEDLENKGILESKMRGKIKLYQIKPTEAAKRYFVFVEQYKQITFMDKNILVKEVLERIKPFIKGIGIVFGSYVKGKEKEGSDLDVFVAGNYNKKEIEDISKNFGIEISMKCYPLNIFKKNLNKDLFLKEILDNHIVFLDIERFIQITLKNE